MTYWLFLGPVVYFEFELLFSDFKLFSNSQKMASAFSDEMQSCYEEDPKARLVIETKLNNEAPVVLILFYCF